MDIPPQWIRGRTSRQAHTGLPPGTVEDEHGRGGFSGPASHLYRLHPPTDWVSVDGPAAHRAYDTGLVEPGPTLWPTTLLANADVAIGFEVVDDTPEAFRRDVDGDLVLFVHTGSGTLRTEYGPLGYRPGDYLVVPKGTTHRVEASAPTRLLTIEARRGRLRLPDRGLLGRHAQFDPALLEVPEAEAIEEKGTFTVVVRRGGADTVVTYPFHPCDVVGWKGDLAPTRLAIEDFRPVAAARYHLPPSVHATFEGDGFVVSTFAPRPRESGDDAVRLPFFHRNVDADEVIFYHRGQFFSRAGIGEGTISFHPTGLHHGPQPEARRRDASSDATDIDEHAVMVDAFQPLTATSAAGAAEIPDYVDTWRA